MKLVIDTNVLIAAFIAKGMCSTVVEHCLIVHSPITSDFILNELHEKLTVKFKYSPEDVREVINLLRSRMQVVIPTPLNVPVCRDVDDDMILATAIAGEAVCIITGDKDLLILKMFESIKIIDPKEFANSEEMLR
ncbi:MAG: putative toxin-antitoxin system toxin component, PIN family [Nostocales cyanobacterium ELA583]|jgi:putative PIN family toxin of toxin-antitoxin system